MSAPSLPPVRPVLPEDHRRVLAKLAGVAGPAHPAVDSLLAYRRQRGARLWECEVGGGAGNGEGGSAVGMLAPGPGRTAMFVPSPVGCDAEAEALTRLVDAVCRSLDPARVRLVQSLLEPDRRRACEAMGQADFRRVAHLVYMEGETASPAPLAPGLELEVQPWAPRHRPLFEAALAASYRQTRDCPALVGLRSVGDILDGYLARFTSGAARRSRWCVIHAGQEPVGVMLISPVPERRAAEMVYLGLAPAWRGRGLGARLLRYGRGLAAEAGFRRMVLAVDRENEPAVRLYRSAGFGPTGHRIAQVRPLG